MNPIRRHFLLALFALFARPLTGRAQAGAKPPATHPHLPLPPWQRNITADTAPSAPRAFATPLRLPGASGLFATADAAKSMRLLARIDRHALFPGRPTDLWTYQSESGGKTHFNPMLQVRKGDVLDVTLANQLGEDTTIHWHGLFVNERNDGSGLYPVASGQSYVYRFRVLNRAGLYWYHPHPHDRTGAQIHFGMGSLLLVEDAEEEALRRAIGVTFGETEIPLLIQDKQIDDRNRIRYAMGEDDWIGNRVLVNWTPEPYLDVMTCLYRFRILNGSNARVYRLAFETDGRRLPFHLIGTDGGLLDRARRLTEIFLAPAQRLDVLLDLEKIPVGARVRLRSLAYDPMENDGRPAIDPAIEHPGAPLMGQALDILELHVTTSLCARRTIPATLSAMPRGAKPLATPRRFRLHIDGIKWRINGWNHHDDMKAVRFTVKRGTTEVWEIRNDTQSMSHPVHIHGFHFRVLDRHSSPSQVRKLAVAPSGLTAGDLGWLDTVLVWPGERVRIAVDFSQPFEGRQTYMFHCHNLEHEDQGMMLNFGVQ